MNNRDVPNRGGKLRAEAQRLTNGERGDKHSTSAIAESNLQSKGGYKKEAKDEKGSKAEDKRGFMADGLLSNKKSNFNLFGLIKQKVTNESKSIDDRVDNPIISQVKPIPFQNIENDHSSGDEKLSKAFGVDLSYAMTPRVQSEHYTNSIELENPDIERSMLTDELRTLNFFLNEDEDSNRQVNSLSAQKNYAQKNSVIYNPLWRNTINETSLNPSSVRVIKNKKEASLFSTQDSRKGIHNSSNKNHNSAYLKDINESEKEGLSTVQEQGETSSINNHLCKEIRYQYGDGYNILEANRNQGFAETQHEVGDYYFNHYVPNVNMSLVRGIGHQNMHQGYYSNYPIEQSSDSKSHKKGKRNCCRIEDTTGFEISIDKINTERKTTLMIKNIPNKYNKELMLETIDEHFYDAYDFFYLPIDFNNNCNVGYAFINFKELKFIESFFKRFNNKKWAIFNSEKICSIKYARIQGKEECERHFLGSSLMKQNVS